MDVGEWKHNSLYFVLLSLKIRCGKGRRGDTVMDGIDQCCKTHDQCFKGEQTWASYYIIGWNWNCGNRQTSEQYKACMCDKEAAQCFAQNSFNWEMRGQCSWILIDGKIKFVCFSLEQLISVSAVSHLQLNTDARSWQILNCYQF